MNHAFAIAVTLLTITQADKQWPEGSERAVAAVRAAAPAAKISEVKRGRDIGLSGEGMALWTVQLSDGTSLDASGDGVLVHRSKPVEDKDLSTLVGNGKAKVAPKGASKIVKLETLGVIRFVAMAKPQVRYVVRVGGEPPKSVTVDGEGKILASGEAKPAKPRVVDANARQSDGPIPELAAKAVEAMRQVFPDMVFDLVEEVPYVDSTTQTIEMLWYEVEFYVAGVKHEFNATEDGLVLQYHKSIAVADLPKAVVEAVASEVPGGKIEDATKMETRGEPRFVALGRPNVVYQIYPVDGESSVKLRMDGTEVKEPEWPEWVKKSTKKAGT